MKGISHFVSGVALASFLPQAVGLAQEGSFILLLAGLGGIMPDTLDFRVGRYLARADLEIDPDPDHPDPYTIAGQIAAAIDRAHDTNKPVRVMLRTVRLGADLWRQYHVHFGGSERDVRVRVGPLVSASRVSYAGSEPDLYEGWASVKAPVHCVYDDEFTVDVFTGPTLEFRPRGDEVELIFLPWHRHWSHSFTVSALLGGLVALLLGPLHGLVYFLGSAAHILEDQLGHMGSNLLYPLTRARIGGLKLFRSGDTWPNLFTVWLSAVLILFNLDRFSEDPVLNVWSCLGIGLVLPWAAIMALSWWRGRYRNDAGFTNRPASLDDISAEAEEIAD